MVNSFDLSAIKMHLFISIETFSPGEHPGQLQIFDDTCQIFCHFFTIVFIECQPFLTRIVKGLFMICFDTMLAYRYANMQTNFLGNFKFKIFKKISVKFIRTSNSVYNFHICFCACQPMILPIKFAPHVLCIPVLTKFRDFSKLVTVWENT